ncbi:MAG: UDP-galactopyranose mutase [Chthoniobacterales bacterium]|nr:UDP-galactopyranose mutase [Chthoniobacterales bacterium]
MRHYNYLIVGSGFSGLTFAERAATQVGKTSLIVDRRDHLGGNAYDYHDAAGVLIHRYGPHYFRTNSTLICDYLSQFTEWHQVNYEILSYSDGRYWNFPINLNTFEQFLGRPSTSEEMEKWLAEHRVPIESPKNSEEVIVSQVGWELYEKFFKGYTLKQWKREPKELDASVCGRISIRTNRDNRYLREEFQALPKEGYTRMFEQMVAACGDKLTLMLQTDYRDVLSSITFDHMIYTGAIDDYFDCFYGPLPYRSLRFEPESFTKEQLGAREKISGKKGFWQPAMQVNYPNEEAFTRIVEMKHATGQQGDNTTIVREYPDDYEPGKEAYYPIPAPDAAALYQRYKTLADGEKNVSFIGRLATYRYYNMDQVVGIALAEFKKLEKIS